MPRRPRGASDPAPPRRRDEPVRRRWPRRLALGLGGVVVLILVTLATFVLVVLYTPVGSRFVLRRALAWYDARIPVTVAVDAIEGTIARGVQMHGVRVVDARQRPLAEARTLELDLSVGALVLGEIDLERVVLRRLTVHLRAEDEAWSDLAITPRREAPTPEPPPLGPDLPLEIRAKVDVQDLFVVHHDGRTPTPVLVDGQIAARVRARGTRAAIALHGGGGRVPPADLSVTRLSGEATWTSPSLRVTDLRLDTDRGALVDVDAHWDLVSERGALALQAAFSAAQIDALLGVPVERATRVRVDAAGSTRGGWIQAHVDAGDRLDLFATSVVAVEPHLVFGGLVEGEAAPALGGLPGTQPIGVATVVDGRRSSSGAFDGRAVSTCTTCPRPLVAAMHTRVSPAVTARVELFGPSGRIDADAVFEGLDEGTATVTLAVDDPARMLAPLAPWIDVPPIHGSLHGRIGCALGERCDLALRGRRLRSTTYAAEAVEARGAVHVAEDPVRLDVRVQARAPRLGLLELARLDARIRGTAARLSVRADAAGRRGEQGRVAAVVRPGERLVLELHEADLRFRDLAARLLSPSTITIADDEIAVQRLRLAAGGGRILADGVIRADGSSRLDLVARGVSLGRVGAWLLGPALRGRLDLRAGVRGPGASPTGTLEGRIAGLGVADLRLGDLALDAALDRAGLRAHAELAGPLARRARVRARLPLHVDLSTRTIEMERGKTLDAALAVDRLCLDAVDPTGTWRGTVDVGARLAGTTTDPSGALTISAAALGVEEVEIGSVQATATWVDARLTANLVAAGPHLRHAELAASVPIEIDPWPVFARWNPDAEQHVALVVDRLKLPGLGAPLLGEPVEGTVSFDLSLDAAEKAVDGRLELRAEDLAVEGLRIGTVRARAASHDDRLVASVRASGPLARRLEVDAAVPVTVSLDPPDVSWAPRRAHEVFASLHDGDLQALSSIVDVGPLSGRVDGTFASRGPLDDVQAGARLVVDRLGYDREALGTATVELVYADDALRLTAHQRRDARQWVRAEATLPVGTDLLQGPRWHREGVHRLAVSGAGLDARAIAPFVDLPANLQLETAFEVAGGGTLEDFVVDGRARVSVEQTETFDTIVGAAFRLRPKAQAFRVVVGPRGPSGLHASLRTRADVGALVRRDAAIDDVAFYGRLQGDDFPLEGLTPFLPVALHDPDGLLTVDVRAEGTLREPDLSGRMALREGAITVVELNQRLQDLRADVRLDGPWVHLDDFAFRSGAGRATGTAELRVGRKATRGRGRLRFVRFPLVKPGLPLMQLDGRLDASLDTRGDVTRIDVVARNTALDVLSLEVIDAPRRIPRHGGVIFVDENAVTGADEGDDRLPSDFVLSFALADPVSVTGPQVDMVWEGAITVAGGEEATRVTGSLWAKRGTLRVGGNEFDFEHAEITLPADRDFDPYVSAVATTETPEAMVTVGVYGRMSRPQLRLATNPPMAESDAFALLVTGSSDAARAEGGSYDARAASLLASFQNPALQRTLQERVGLDRVGVGFGEDIDQPIVTAGKRFSRKLYVETLYHHNAPPDENQAELRLEYVFRPPNWTLETSFGTAAAGGIGVWWRKRFGGPERRDRPPPAPIGPPSPGERGEGPPGEDRAAPR